MLISPAFASFAGPSSGDFLSFLPLLAVLGIMYVFFFRTQQKKDKEHKELVANLSRGDRVLTTGGLIGVVSKVGPEQEIMLEVAPGVQVAFFKGMVTAVLGQQKIKESSEKAEKSHLNLATPKAKTAKTKAVKSEKADASTPNQPS